MPFKPIKARERITIVFASICFSFFFCLGLEFSKNECIFWGYNIYKMYAVIGVIITYAIIRVLFGVIDKYTSLSERKAKHIPFFVIFFTILLLLLPAYLALFPGYSTYDGPIVLIQMYKEHIVSGQQPVIYTFLLVGFLELGKRLFNNLTVGFALFSAFQWLIVTLALSRGATWVL